MKQSRENLEGLNEKLSARLNAKNNLLNHIYAISALLTRSPDLDEVLNEIVDRVMNGLNFDRAIVMLLNKDKTRLECKCIKGFTPEGEKRAWEKPLIIGTHDCYETKVIRYGKPQFFQDTAIDPDITEIDRVVNKYQERKSVLYVPLELKGEVIGIIGVDRYRTRMEITQDDVESLAIFANQAAIVIENARLYRALSDEKAVSENIIECSVDGIIVSDLMGNILNLNPRAEELLEISREDAKESLIQEIFGFDETERKRIYRALKRKENVDHFEILYHRKRGKSLVCDLTAFPLIDENQNILGAVTLITDLTEKKKMDDYLSRVEKFAALGRIASGIAHEIRNPLAGIYTTVQNLEGELGENFSSKTDLQNIMQEIDRMEKLIREILDLVRPFPLQIEKTEVNSLISIAVSLISKEAKQKGIVVETRFNHGIGCIEADSNRLRQVFLNLIINAIESIRGTGTIVISTETLKSEDGKDKWILIKFKDNGVGIPSGNINKIFDPFFTTKNVGTGLGLTVSHKIVQDHNGIIEVESKENKGTTFYVKLPVKS
jgi:PAS domain S-box-containing protein